MQRATQIVNVNWHWTRRAHREWSSWVPVNPWLPTTMTTADMTTADSSRMDLGHGPQ